MYRVLLLILLLFTTVFAAHTPQSQSRRRPLVFEPNRGQAPEDVSWIGRGPGYQVLFTGEGLTILPETSRDAIQMKFRGGRPGALTGTEPTGGVSHYFRGTDSRNWQTGIPHYSRLSAARVYPGVDIVFYDHSGDLEYDFVIAPEADPKQIRLAFDGAQTMRVDAQSGDLVLTTGSGDEIRQRRPLVYQNISGKRVEIRSGYELVNGRDAAVTLAAYDREHPLVIDPIIAFSRTLGGTLNEQASAIAVDHTGAAYVTGWTFSGNFPVLHAIDPTHDCSPVFGCNEVSDAFVTKLSPDGVVQFSTYLGGSNSDRAHGIAVDSTGVYVTGLSGSDDFPSQDPRRGGEAFVTKLSPSGDRIIYSRTIGGTGFDYANAIAVDSTQRVWVTGITMSNDFPQTTARYGSGGEGDAFYMRLSSTGVLQYSQVTGGTGNDHGGGVAVDRDDAAWMTGGTCSADFPTTVSPVNRTGPCSAFVLALTTRNGIRFSTVFGGSETGDTGKAIAVVADQQAYITGTTLSPNFPVTPDAYQSGITGSGSRAFVTRLDGKGAITSSTVMGVDGSMTGNAIALNSTGEVYVGGSRGIRRMTPSGFVARFSPDLHTLAYSINGGGNAVLGLATAPPVHRQPQAFFAAGKTLLAGEDAFVTKWTEDVRPKYGLLWHDETTGELISYFLDDHFRIYGDVSLSWRCGASDGCSQKWKAYGTGDFNRDGYGDVLWYNSGTGEITAWLLNGAGGVIQALPFSRRCGVQDACSTTWRIIGVTDRNGDAISDVVWQNLKTGAVQAWIMNGAGSIARFETLGKYCGPADGCSTVWKPLGTGDFNQDGVGDLLWMNSTTGELAAWLLNRSSAGVNGPLTLSQRCETTNGCLQNFRLAGTAELNGDGTADLLWHDAQLGGLLGWEMGLRGKVEGAEVIPFSCGAYNGCSARSRAIGLLRDYHVTP